MNIVLLRTTNNKYKQEGKGRILSEIGSYDTSSQLTYGLQSNSAFKLSKLCITSRPPAELNFESNYTRGRWYLYTVVKYEKKS